MTSMPSGYEGDGYDMHAAMPPGMSARMPSGAQQLNGMPAMQHTVYGHSGGYMTSTAGRMPNVSMMSGNMPTAGRSVSGPAYGRPPPSTSGFPNMPVSAGWQQAPPSSSSSASHHDSQQALDPSSFPSLPGGPAGQPGMAGAPPSFGNALIGSGAKKDRQNFSIMQDEFPTLSSAGTAKPDGSEAPGFGAPGSRAPPSSADAGSLATATSAAATASSPATSAAASPQLLPNSSSAPPTLGPGDENGQLRYGLLGLLNVLHSSNNDLRILALGLDLTTLGLDLNPAREMHPSFVSPWTGTSSEPGSGVNVPSSYKTDKVPKLQRKIGSLTDETLFYIFYFMPGDVMQHAAAYILYERDWRYHKEHKFWMQRAGENQASQNQTYEQGSYYIFDVASWKRVTKSMTLRYEALEPQREMPPAPS